MSIDPADDKDPAAETASAVSQFEELLGRMSVLHHKINNPLTSLLGRAQMLPLKLRQGDAEQVARAVEVIEDSSRRVAALIQELSSAVSQARERLQRSGRRDQG
jgi:signal transduction histidine kinase